MSIRVRCPGCLEPFRVREESAGLRARCRKCPARFRLPGRLTAQVPTNLAVPEGPEELGPVPETLPWTPTQVFAASFVFGPLAGGVVSGINFLRMGQGVLLLPSVLAGALLFLGW